MKRKSLFSSLSSFLLEISCAYKHTSSRVFLFSPTKIGSYYMPLLHLYFFLSLSTTLETMHFSSYRTSRLLMAAGCLHSLAFTKFALTNIHSLTYMTLPIESMLRSGKARSKVKYCV